jgi:hypothetical protein
MSTAIYENKESADWQNAYKCWGAEINRVRESAPVAT